MIEIIITINHNDKSKQNKVETASQNRLCWNGVHSTLFCTCHYLTAAPLSKVHFVPSVALVAVLFSHFYALTLTAVVWKRG